MRPPALQQSTPREPHERGPAPCRANISRCILTDDGLLSAVLTSALGAQNHNDVSLIKEFGCSHYRHVLYVHNRVVCCRHCTRQSFLVNIT